MSQLEANKRWKEKRLSENGCIKCSRKAMPDEKYCKSHKPHGIRTGIKAIQKNISITPLALEFIKSKNLILPEVFKYGLNGLGFEEYKKNYQK